MSVYSDDTDVLLLIPPNFFSVESDTEDQLHSQDTSFCELVSQINHLEDRVNFIEHGSLSNSAEISDSLSKLTFGRPGSSRTSYFNSMYGSSDNLNTLSYKSYTGSRSLQPSPVKSKFLTFSPPFLPQQNVRKSFEFRQRSNMLTSNEYITRKQLDDRTIKEIEDYLINRKGLKVENNNGVTQEVIEGSSEMESSLRLSKLHTERGRQSSVNSDSPSALSGKHNAGLNMSDTSYSESGVRRKLEFENNDRSSSDKQSAKFDYDINNEGCSVREEICVNIPGLELGNQIHDSKNVVKYSGVSLVNLWGDKYQDKKDKLTVEEELFLTKQRLEEERCRRKHCEERIQHMILQLLEEQEKLAVAVKVDTEKDEEISGLEDGLRKVIEHCRDLEEHKNLLVDELKTGRNKQHSEIESVTERLKRCESELSTALEMARDYKEKSEMSDIERLKYKGDYTKEIMMLKTELKKTVTKVTELELENNKIRDNYVLQEELLQQNKNKTFEFQSLVGETKKKLRESEVEVYTLRQELEKQAKKTKDDVERVKEIEQSKRNLQQSYDESRKREKQLRVDVKNLTEQVDKVKVELKDFYQKQVETVVREKLKEFQDQLIAAETAMNKELQDNEQAVAEKALKQMQQMGEKHVAEIRLLEEKHKEEIDLWKIQLAQSEERISDLQQKLQNYTTYNTHVAEKLQSVMEAQWQEALKILSLGPPSPQNSPSKSSSRESNIKDSDKLPRQNTFTFNGKVTQQSESSSSSSGTPFGRDDQVTCRDNENPLTYRINETPEKMTHGSQDYLKMCIQALLERSGFPTDDSANTTDLQMDSLIHELNARHAVNNCQLKNMLSDPPLSSGLYLELNKNNKPESGINKPPWK